MRPSLLRILALVALLWSAAGFLLPAASAQVPSNVDNPRTWVVNQLNPWASDEGKGTRAEPFVTIGRAAEAAMPGDTVLVHAGIYRERVAPARGGLPGRPIVYRAAPGEDVVVRGSDVMRYTWKPLRGHAGVFFSLIDTTRFESENPYRTRLKGAPGRRTLGQVFVDGEPLSEVDSRRDLLVRPGTWMAGRAGDTVYVHFKPSPTGLANRLIELTMRSRLFAPRERGLGYIHVEGFTFEHCANQFPERFWDEQGAPQAGAVSTRSGHHWVIEHNTIRNAKTIGLDVGSEGAHDLEGDRPVPEKVGYHIIRHNTITDNGCCGIVGWRHRGTHIISNVIERNNRLGWSAPEAAGIKVHGFADGRIEGNLVRDNDAFGIWLDNVYRGARVTRNVVVGNQGAGIFVERGGGPVLVDNNIVAYTRMGDGIYTRDAGGVTVAHNLLYGNTHFGVFMRTVTDRSYRRADGSRDTVATVHQRILNNLFIGNYRGHIALPVPTERDFDNVADYNLFVDDPRTAPTSHWEGVAPHRFVLHGRRDHLEEALSEEDMARPSLSLEAWRRITGSDRHSLAVGTAEADQLDGIIEQGSLALSARALYLDVNPADLMTALEGPAVPGVNRDFYGRFITGGKAYAGPFQGPDDDARRYYLWPVPIAAPDMGAIGAWQPR